MLEVKQAFFIAVVSPTAAISKTLFVYFNKCCRSSIFLFNKHALMWNRDNDLLFQEILELVNVIVITTFSWPFFCPGEEFLNWLNKSDRSEKSFNRKELFLLIYVSLLLVKQLSGGEFTKEKKFLFVNILNGKISSQHGMQYQRSLDPWRYL